MSRAPAKRNDSWISIEWENPNGPKKPPSAVHGVLDQITGRILGDEHLIKQGKREWRRASEHRAALRRKRRTGDEDAPYVPGAFPMSPTHRSRSGKKSARSAGFWATLFGGKSGVKTRTLAHHSTSRKPGVRTTSSRPTGSRQNSSKARGGSEYTRRPSQRDAPRRPSRK